MSERPSVCRLPDGRLHLSHGPIDLVIEAFGRKDAVRAAYAGAIDRFETILDELCEELPLIRTPADRLARVPEGVVARRMVAAVAPYCRNMFITPMAAVAGAVADEILEAMTAVATLDRAYVNNGGDIALALGPHAEFSVGIVDRPDRPSLVGTAQVTGGSPVRGVATSGWRGRSFSLGIADAVTVLANSSAAADAAATVVANAVDLPGHPLVERVPAVELQPDSDLGDRLVTVAVGTLSSDDIELALATGRKAADLLVRECRIEAAALFLAGFGRVVGELPIAGAMSVAFIPQSESERRPVYARHYLT
ncbi:MAG TPA: UPF0280 family protein [Stellaceae bacterium]|nr:UPF0280 family protein [Stellaceae bacterium]